jgi:hypothetical protein
VLPIKRGSFENSTGIGLSLTYSSYFNLSASSLALLNAKEKTNFVRIG